MHLVFATHSQLTLKSPETEIRLLATFIGSVLMFHREELFTRMVDATTLEKDSESGSLT